MFKQAYMMHTYILILPQNNNYCHQVAENLKSVKEASKVSFILISKDLLIYVCKKKQKNISACVYRKIKEIIK